jgi:hypothetical protein
MQSAEDSVEDDPDQRDQNDGIVVRDGNVGAAGFDVIARELFLASGTLIPGGEKAEYHFNRENGPCNNKDGRHPLQRCRNLLSTVQPETDITDQQKNKKNGAVSKTHIMEKTDNADPMRPASAFTAIFAGCDTHPDPFPGSAHAGSRCFTVAIRYTAACFKEKIPE